MKDIIKTIIAIAVICFLIYFFTRFEPKGGPLWVKVIYEILVRIAIAVSGLLILGIIWVVRQYFKIKKQNRDGVENSDIDNEIDLFRF
jgi:hypothetical protein